MRVITPNFLVFKFTPNFLIIKFTPNLKKKLNIQGYEVQLHG